LRIGATASRREDLQDRLFKIRRSTVLWTTVLEEVAGDDGPLKSRASSSATIKTNVFSERRRPGYSSRSGTRPLRALRRAGRDEPSGYIRPHLFDRNVRIGRIAAGDVTDDIYRRR